MPGLYFLLWISLLASVAIGAGFAVGRLVRAPRYSSAVAGAISVVVWWALCMGVWFLAGGADSSSDYSALGQFIAFALLYLIVPAPFIWISSAVFWRWRTSGHRVTRPPREAN